MKNIHLLSTELPSRLYLEYGDGDLCLANTILPQTQRSNNQHLYITSDDKIEVGDYHFNYTNKTKVSNYNLGTKNPNIDSYRKIILTTDPILIEGGVQEIDDEFLKWFVNNPTCEFVEYVGDNCYREIIIPEENPLDKISSQDLSPETQKLINDNWDYLIGSDENKQEEFGKYFADNADMSIVIERPKESMEISVVDGAEKWVFETNSHKWSNNDATAGDNFGSFIAGAKWMEKRTYTEDEVRELIIKALTHNDHNLCGSLVTRDGEIRTANFNVWFEEFKKK